MAIVMEGFSIREYASKMRSHDVVKCWPFGEASEEVVGAILPPMTVEKFSWWFDKLQLVQHDENGDDESPQSLRKKRGAEKGKAKAKVPKKRSIVELFAAVPQVERVSYSSEDGDDDNGDGSDDEEDGGDGDDKRVNKKGVKGKVVMIKNLKRDKATKKQKGKNVAVDSSATKKKDKVSKHKLQSSADVVAICKSPTHRKDLFDGFSSHLKKPRLKRSTPQKSKCKTSTNYKFFPNDQQEAVAVRGIFKNQNRMDGSKLSNCDTGHVDKNANFSAMDDVLKPSWKACPAMIASECNMNSDVIVASSAKGQASVMERSVRTNVRNHTEEDINEKPVSSRHNISDGSNFVLGQHDFRQANLFGKLAVPYGVGPPHSRSYDRVTLHKELYSCSYQFPSTPEEPYNRNVMIPVFNHSRDSLSGNPRLLDLSGCAGPKFDSDCSMDFMKTYPRPPTSYHSPVHNNTTCSPLFPIQNIRKNHYEQALSPRWIPHLSPKELMHSICSLPDSNSRASRYKKTSINKDFVGLPLNSQGELISMNSSGRDGYNQIRSMNAGEGPPFSSVTHNNVVLSHPNMIEHCVLPSRVGVTNQYDVGKSSTAMHAFNPCLSSIDSVVEQMKVFHIDCRPHDHVQELPGNDLIRQPRELDHLSLQVSRSTMRLMGKEFTVGGRDLEGYQDREGSAVKHIITGHHGGRGSGTGPSASIRCHEKSPRFVVHPILGKLRETGADFPKATTNRAFESDPSVMVSESNVSSQFLDSHNNIRNQNDGTKSKGMLMPEFHPHGSLTSSPSPNRYSSTLSSAHNSHPESSQISIPASTPPGSSQYARTRRNVPGAGNHFPFKFPFSDSKSERHVHPPSVPYVLHSREKRTVLSYCHPSSVPDHICYPCSISGENYGIEGSVISRPQSFHLSTHSPSQNSFTPAPFAYHPSLPVHPGFSMPSRRGPRFTLDNQMQSRLSVRVPGPGIKSKKRLPSAPNVSNKSPKIPKIRVQDDCCNAVVELEASSSFRGDFQCNKLVSEPSAVVKLGQSAVHEPVGSPLSGPVELAAGSRHILKPSLQNDLVNSEPDDSTSDNVVASRVVGCEKSSETHMF